MKYALRLHILHVAFIGLLTLGLTIGCAEWEPYGVIGVGYKTSPSSQELLDDGRNPTARLELGYETPNRTRVGWCHTSHWIDGFPFNGKSEFQLDELCVNKQFGGQ